MTIGVNRSLREVDFHLAKLLERERARQSRYLQMIASENYTSLAVMQAQGSVLTNKYAEGYPNRRYYDGCDVVDRIESLAIERACQVFNCKFANVQPHSGTQANQAVMLAFMQPGDVFLAMGLDSGGHLTHGHAVNLSGKWFQAKHYGVNDQGWIDLDEVRALAKKHRPKMIIAGGSAYGRSIDFAGFRSIADEVGSMLWSDVAHYAGLIAGGAYVDPVPDSHVCTFTTHKTLRGPRGGMVICNDSDLATKVDRAVFPGLQGGPCMNVIAAKAVMFQECNQPDFFTYAHDTVKCARLVAHELNRAGIPVLTKGTDSHIIMIDLKNLNLRGSDISASLYRSGIVTNKNSVPNDPHPPSITSGVRLGTAACVTRGLQEREFLQISSWIIQIVNQWKRYNCSSETMERRILSKVRAMIQNFPVYL